VHIETFGTGTVPDAKIVAAINEVFDLRPYAITTQLDLLKPRYQKTAAYGHFGREDEDFTWEKTDKADALKAAV
jgi:S-adenosylmethionine synthetase